MLTILTITVIIGMKMHDLTPPGEAPSRLGGHTDPFMFRLYGLGLRALSSLEPQT